MCKISKPIRSGELAKSHVAMLVDGMLEVERDGKKEVEREEKRNCFGYRINLKSRTNTKMRNISRKE